MTNTTILTNVKYDESIEVTKRQYELIMSRLAGTCAGRQEGEKYFIKLWIMSYKEQVLEIIQNF